MSLRKKSTYELSREREENRADLYLKRNPIYVVAENIRSLDNVGLMFRLCELARVKKLYLCGITGHPAGGGKDRRPRWEVERNDQRIRKTSIYAVPYQPWEYGKNISKVIRELKNDRVKIVVLEQTRSSKDYTQVDYKVPLALVVGHERRGVSQKIIKEADEVIEIPIYGIGNSHNVALATGIVLYHILDKIGVSAKI